MLVKIWLRTCLAVFATLALFSSALSLANASDSKTVYITVHKLHEGKTIKDVEAYYKKLEPIFNRHGLKRFNGYQIASKIAGHADVNPVIMHVWKIENPGVLQKIVADKEYQAQVPERNKIFNMPEMQGWIGVLQ